MAALEATTPALTPSAIELAPAVPPFLLAIAASHTPIRTDHIPLAFNAPASSHLPSTPLASPSPSLQPSAPPVPVPLYLPPPALLDEQPELVAPENFAMVSGGVFRSSFPKKKNFPFLKSLGLRTILLCHGIQTLILEEYPPANLKFLEEEGISFKQFGIPGNKEPFDQIPEDVITSALVFIMDRRNHPLLIHCNKGKHRTGCLVGCLRRLQSWSLTSTFDEYIRFSAPKSRQVDQQFIELFRPASVWEAIAAAGSSTARPTAPVSSASLNEEAIGSIQGAEQGGQREQAADSENDAMRWVPAWELLPRAIRRCRRDEDQGGETGRSRMILGL